MSAINCVWPPLLRREEAFGMLVLVQGYLTHEKHAAPYDHLRSPEGPRHRATVGSYREGGSF